MTPPEVEEALCETCTRRVDCLVDPPFIVNEFLANNKPLQKWDHTYCDEYESLIDQAIVTEL